MPGFCIFFLASCCGPYPFELGVNGFSNLIKQGERNGCLHGIGICKNALVSQMTASYFHEPPLEKLMLHRRYCRLTKMHYVSVAIRVFTTYTYCFIDLETNYLYHPPVLLVNAFESNSLSLLFVF